MKSGKKRIALLSGGDSGEYEISLKSAAEVEKQIDKNAYEVFTISLRGGAWYYMDAEGERTDVDKNDFSLLISGERIHFDLAFILIHGTPGEDGRLPAYFEMIGLPYTSCNPYVSSITFHKYYSHSIARTLGLNTADTYYLRKGQPYDAGEIEDFCGLPCFVKPCKGGSSVGMSLVRHADELNKAIDRAMEEDDEIVVDSFIHGTEITCAILQTKQGMLALPLCEIVSKNDFFDYEAKYTDGMADEIVPARVSLEVEQQCKTVSAYLYNKLNCKGIVRFDFILSDNELFLLEANTIPGLSANSIVPKMVRNMGYSLKDFYTMIIEASLME
jgi:D-alanine-D-alanine ligase